MATIGAVEHQLGWTGPAAIAGQPLGDLQMHHIAYVVSGRFHVRMDDGRELDLGPGDAHVVGPGHDAWVVGDEPCVTIDFIPAGADAPATG